MVGINRFLTIHRFQSINRVKSWAVFFFESTVAHLGVTKLALDNPKRVFYLGTDAGLELFDPVQDGAQRALLIQYSSFSGSTWLCAS